MSDLGQFKYNIHHKIILFVYLIINFFEGILTLRSILNIPGEESSALAFGFSGARLILFMGVLAINLCIGVILLKSVVNLSWYSKIYSNLLEKLAVDKIFGSILLLSVFGIIAGSNFLVIIPEIHEPVALAYYVRLEPVMQWGVIGCILTILGISLVRFDLNLSSVRKWGRRIYAFLFTFGVFLIIGLWISGTGNGLDPIDEGIGWHALGTPLLETQVLASWGITMGIFFLWSWLNMRRDPISKNQNNWVDIIICTALWLTAFSLWMAQPLKPNWFAAEPRAPNYVFYPNSDSSVYDVTAQNLLLGDGFKTRGSPFTLRPLYTAFLALLHKIGGLDYEPIIWMQVAILAFIPVVLYVLAKLLYNRFSGLLAALLIIFREMNAIKLGDSISDAHAKLLLPFLPTTLGILLFLWFFSAWVRNPTRRPFLAIITGSIAGFFMLIRPEVGVLLPFVGLAALFQLRKHPTIWMKGFALIAVGLVMAIGPWIWRNYQITGTIYIDSPHYRLDLITKRYRENPIGFSLPENPPTPTTNDIGGDALDYPEGDSANPLAPIEPPLTPPVEPTSKQISPPAATTSPDDAIQQLTGEMAEDVINFVQENPDTTTNFIVNHFMNSLVQTVLGLPISHPITLSTVKFLGHKSVSQFWLECCSLLDYERKFQFWPKWDGQLPLISVIPTIFNLTIVAIGISGAWRKQKFIGIFPLVGAFGYYLINALARNSGGRYIIPVNWVGIFYFSIGIAKVTSLAFSPFKPRAWKAKFSKKAIIDTKITTFTIWNKSNLGLATLILILGCTLPLLEIAIPPKYKPSVVESRINQFFQENQPGISNDDKDYLETFIHNGGQVLQGLAFYPRYHKPYQMGSVWSIYQERPYSHIDFYLSSPYDMGVVLALDTEPIYFPSASNVIVFACPQRDYHDALAVFLINEGGEPIDIMWRSNIPNNSSCPLPVAK